MTSIWIVFILTSGLAIADEQIKLQAVAAERLEISFRIDEKRLRKLNEVIKKRLGEVGAPFDIDYTVTFSDRSSYETNTAEPILREENAKTRRITALAISA
jgi:hypothetical protein